MMNIVLAANDSYMEHLAVTLVSILINSNANDKFKFYILSNDISNLSKKRLNNLKKIKDFEIEFCDIGEDDFGVLPIKWHYTKQIYYRLRMPDLIKEDKVLYLDSDIIVRKSLQDFWNTDLKGNIAAVIEDILIGNESNKNDKYRLIIESENYFNSGVMLWDLEKARQNNIAEKSIKYIQENAQKISYYDQDALNCSLDENCVFVDKKYNFQYNRRRQDIKTLYNNLKKEIVIMHFVTSEKPWNNKEPLLFSLEYYFYAMMTPWRLQALKHLFCNIFLKSMAQKLRKTKICLTLYN